MSAKQVRTLATKMSSSNIVDNEPMKQELPKFPVPNLENTLNVFLESAKPFCTPEEYCSCEEKVKDFKQNDGRKCQEKLVERAKGYTNWLKDYWIHSAYLEYRKPVVVFSSTGQVFPALQFVSPKHQLYYAAKLVMAATELSQCIRENKLPQEKMGKELLDMSQYKSVFGATRVPRPKRDQLIVNPDSKHIIVMSNNHIYRLPVLDHSRKMFNFTQTYKSLKALYLESQETQGQPIGGFTALDRDNWAKLYGELEQVSGNSVPLQYIRDALFVLCLDDVIESPTQKYLSLGTLSGHYMLHAYGTIAGNNRWFDKILQICVSRNGLSGITYEHTPGEGQTVTLLTDYISDFVAKGRELTFPEVNSSNVAEKLKIELPQKCVQMIPSVYENLTKLSNEVDFQFLSYQMYGREFIKRFKFSPDSFIQVALQLAFGRIHMEPGAQYESASLRKFIDGRTECIRSCTCEVRNFVIEMLESSSTSQKRFNALKTAINSHKNYVNLAVNGKGCDRHLLGLRIIASENNMPEHDLFKEVGFVKSSRMRLSTSQVASQSFSFMCYAPLVDDGYGCCYNPRANDILFAVSAFNSCKETSAQKFAKNLAEALCDMQQLCYENAGSKL